MAATDDVKPCLLLELPAELRNRIYEYALTKKDHIDLYHWRRFCKKWTAGRWIGDVYRSYMKEPAFLRTCRQVRNEALPLFYSRNVFGVPCNARVIMSDPDHLTGDLRDDIEAWTMWVSSITPEKRALIKGIKVYEDGQPSETVRRERLWLGKNAPEVRGDVFFVEVFVEDELRAERGRKDTLHYYGNSRQKIVEVIKKDWPREWTNQPTEVHDGNWLW